MPRTLDKPAIEKLSIEERLKLLRTVMETLVADGMPLGPDLEEIRRRAADADKNPDDGYTLEEFRELVRKRRK